jgi:hypothetical protein
MLPINGVKTWREVRAKARQIKRLGMADYSPEKAGVGGSTPSLATIFISDLATQPKISHL